MILRTEGFKRSVYLTAYGDRELRQVLVEVKTILALVSADLLCIRRKT